MKSFSFFCLLLSLISILNNLLVPLNMLESTNVVRKPCVCVGIQSHLFENYFETFLEGQYIEVFKVDTLLHSNLKRNPIKEACGIKVELETSNYLTPLTDNCIILTLCAPLNDSQR